MEVVQILQNCLRYIRNTRVVLFGTNCCRKWWFNRYTCTNKNIGRRFSSLAKNTVIINHFTSYYISTNAKSRELWSQTFKEIDRSFGPTPPLPLLTVVVMLPTAIKHTLVLFATPVYWFAPAFSAIAVCSVRPTNYSQWAVYFSEMSMVTIVTICLHWRKHVKVQVNSLPSNAFLRWRYVKVIER